MNVTLFTRDLKVIGVVSARDVRSDERRFPRESECEKRDCYYDNGGTLGDDVVK